MFVPCRRPYQKSEHPLLYLTNLTAVCWLGEIVRTSASSIDFTMASSNSDDAPAFSPAFQHALKQNPEALWAVNLSQRTWGTTLWMLGEYRSNATRRKEFFSKMGLRSEALEATAMEVLTKIVSERDPTLG